MGSKDNNLSVFEDSGRKDDVQNNIFLQNELPQKEETSTSGENLRGEGEMSSSAVGYEPDGLDFDGLGDLFNEPEIADMPNLKPSSSDTNIQANEIAETGFLVGNSSESDPDEVDNSDSPVSIESCLAFFIKPELLSNEHGWHCENCSKALQEQRMQSKRRQQRATSKIQTSEVQDRVQSAPSSSTKDCPCPGELGCLSNGDSRKHVVSTFDESLVSHNEKINASQNYSNETSQKAELKQGNGEMNEALEELSQTSSYKTCTQASISGESSDSCSVNEPSNAGCDTDEVQQRKPKLLPKGSELEGSDNEKLNSDSMKVKRDATKRILINRVPPILTIHLKRFSQDARGRLSKLNGHVDFRDTIDLRPYMDPRCTGTDEYKFRLTGVVEHLGTMRGGHYVAYVRSTKGSRKAEQENRDFVWYHASDAYVREASLEEVHRCEAYILFYEKL
ncbi:Ubiquitin carboxyl-terminal hydrolase [Actinidia chinensis var. chinensis]|uniref:Ubiquitin carboxyl-terminal hydrolase n=1 Tax=Actinidia chinensis var. chinensis TaxID=1590841 RepID=A0A2R6PX90_ACTCC|nr:Ubiquitin carboxyl-terminal hydrolase [Actinidia chinensis var. chinensis]